MAGGSLIMLLDDIATILDDVAVMSKVAVKKTAGVLGDDLALNAKQVTGVSPARELPVVWAVAKGSLVNKAILVPGALLISGFWPAAVKPLLMIGGAYLCYEGVEKLAHRFLHSHDEVEKEHAQLIAHVADETVDLVAVEKEKIRGAIRTDFVLSAEIIVISLATVGDFTLMTRTLVLIVISIIMTVGVYGLVALIVKMDDAGIYLSKKNATNAWGSIQRNVGFGLLSLAPLLLKFLAVAGTIAMFLVGGHILVEGLPVVHDTFHHWSELVAEVPVVGWLLEHIVAMSLDALFGVLVGSLVLLVVTIGKKLFWSSKKPTNAAAH